LIERAEDFFWQVEFGRFRSFALAGARDAVNVAENGC
jgi:hypothetical protein